MWGYELTDAAQKAVAAATPFIVADVLARVEQGAAAGAADAIGEAVRAERERIIALAREMGAAYPVAAGPASRAAWTETASSFADFLAGVPAGGQGCA